MAKRNKLPTSDEFTAVLGPEDRSRCLLQSRHFDDSVRYVDIVLCSDSEWRATLSEGRYAELVSGASVLINQNVEILSDRDSRRGRFYLPRGDEVAFKSVEPIKLRFFSNRNTEGSA